MKALGKRNISFRQGDPAPRDCGDIRRGRGPIRAHVQSDARQAMLRSLASSWLRRGRQCIVFHESDLERAPFKPDRADCMISAPIGSFGRSRRSARTLTWVTTAFGLRASAAFSDAAVDRRCGAHRGPARDASRLWRPDRGTGDHDGAGDGGRRASCRDRATIAIAATSGSACAGVDRLESVAIGRSRNRRLVARALRIEPPPHCAATPTLSSR